MTAKVAAMNPEKGTRWISLCLSDCDALTPASADDDDMGKPFVLADALTTVSLNYPT